MWFLHVDGDYKLTVILQSFNTQDRVGYIIGTICKQQLLRIEHTHTFHPMIRASNTWYNDNP